MSIKFRGSVSPPSSLGVGPLPCCKVPATSPLKPQPFPPDAKTFRPASIVPCQIPHLLTVERPAPNHARCPKHPPLLPLCFPSPLRRASSLVPTIDSGSPSPVPVTTVPGSTISTATPSPIVSTLPHHFSATPPLLPGGFCHRKQPPPTHLRPVITASTASYGT